MYTLYRTAIIHELGKLILKGKKISLNAVNDG